MPKELERICLKALAKRKPERYTIARDMAEDLRHFAVNPAAHEAASVRVQVPSTRDVATPPLTPTPGAASTPQVISDRTPLKIVPKGLRSFDASDASFFLDLLPGPRDRDGLPESIRFWKTRIESRDLEVTFSAGVLYGPSGCGKSSLVKAGLIPHLAEHIVPIYLEATGDDTEVRLSRAIRRACPEFGDDLSLTLLLKNLRRGVGLPSGKKALIVLDQFEQWLHAKRGQTNLELPAALRQCDGERVQCLILVRDDFWLAISRFLEELEISLLQGRSCAMADLFDPPHARKVLDAFGVRRLQTAANHPPDIFQALRLLTRNIGSIRTRSLLDGPLDRMLLIRGRRLKMQIPVMIESLPGNRFRATSTMSLPLMAEGNSAEESLRLWRERFASVLPQDAQVVAVEESAAQTHPFAKFIGTLKNDRLVELWREGVEEYRRQRDREDGIE